VALGFADSFSRNFNPVYEGQESSDRDYQAGQIAGHIISTPIAAFEAAVGTTGTIAGGGAIVASGGAAALTPVGLATVASVAAAGHGLWAMNQATKNLANSIRDYSQNSSPEGTVKESKHGTGEAPKVREPNGSQPVVEGPSGGGAARDVKVARKHREGNRQVTADGQRWHLPKDESPSAIPAKDPVGDKLQASVEKTAAKWDKSLLSVPEAERVAEAQAARKPWQAARLEAQAKGRWVERETKKLFPELKWQSKGVDAVDPKTGIKYEVLSGTQSNLDTHAKREGMNETLFRMITF
jgi:hypothetical protein